MLGASRWSSSLQCAVEPHAIGHRRRCTLSSSSSHRALSLSHRARRRRRAVPLAVVGRRRHRRHASSSSSLRRRLAAPRAVVHRRCTVVPLSRRWIRRRRLPLSSLLCRLRRRAVGRRRCGAIGRRRRTVFASPGLSMGWWRGRCWGPLRVACVAVVVTVHHRCCRRFIVSHDRCRALVRDAWALQPGGGWLRGVALAPPNCGGGCALWRALVVATRAVGRWAIGTARLCAAPGPLGPVDGGMGGCHWCRPIVFAAAASCGCGRWWVAAQSFHAISFARFCATRGVSLDTGVSRGGRVPHGRGGGQRTFTPLRRCWTVGQCLGHIAVARISTTLGPWGLLATWPGIPSVSSSALGVASRRRRVSWVVACTDGRGSVARLCATPWLWLWRHGGGGGGTL